MKKQKIMKVVAMIGIFTWLFGFLPGCRIGSPEPTEPEEPLTFSEAGASLTGLYMTHQGMARGPYYVFKQTDDGFLMKITDTDPQTLLSGNQNAQTNYPDDAHFFGVDTVLDEESASLVRLEDDGIVRELEEAIVKADALRWDGWDKKGNPGLGWFDVMDSGDSYNLYLELSNGTSVTMHGYDICPDGWNELFFDVTEIFERNQDDPETPSEPTQGEETGKIPSATEETEEPNETENTTLLAENLVGNWTQTVYEPEEDGRELMIMLYLADPSYGGAYLDIYDGTTLDSIARYEGTWACKDAQCLELDLTCTENDDGSNFYDQAIKGTYLYSRSDDAEMTLTLAVKDEKTTPLYTGHRDEPITFRLTNPDDFVETEERMCSVELNYHEAVYGYLPGYACSEGYEDGYYLIHLYDDMGDHTATAAWYMINPDSLKGYDYMTGDAIDFADYLEAKAVG